MCFTAMVYIFIQHRAESEDVARIVAWNSTKHTEYHGCEIPVKLNKVCVSENKSIRLAGKTNILCLGLIWGS